MTGNLITLESSINTLENSYTLLLRHILVNQ